MAEKCYRYRAEHFHGLCANRFKDVSGSGECTICVKPTQDVIRGVCGCAANEIVLPRLYNLKVEKSDLFGTGAFGITAQMIDEILGDHEMVSNRSSRYDVVSNQPCDAETDVKPMLFIFERFYQFRFQFGGVNIPIVDGVKKINVLMSLIIWNNRNGVPDPFSAYELAKWSSVDAIPVCSYNYPVTTEMRFGASPSLQEQFRITLSTIP